MFGGVCYNLRYSLNQSGDCVMCLFVHPYAIDVKDHDGANIYVDMKYDALPEADKGHYEPALIMSCLAVDKQTIIKYKNGAYSS